jgi:hypothetical protein
MERYPRTLSLDHLIDLLSVEIVVFDNQEP